ncbi:MAG TPA: GNAT family N-acetyltransferase [Thermoplasmata archaeon]|nr:GNAT family N-acetyltransferase [Thermoplasmata archaeon]
MTAEQFRGYIEPAIRQYAAEHVRSGRWEEAGSIDRARAEFDRLLPTGVETPGQFLFQIRADGVGDAVGHLWVADRRADGSPGAYVYDLEVYPRYRRRGFAAEAMRAAEEFARIRGATSIALHVFGHNANAIGLYEKLGYRTTNRIMAKELVR